MKPTLRVVLAKVRGGSVSLGPFNAVTFEDGKLWAASHELARHEDHQWVNDQGRFTRVQIDRRVRVLCTRGSENSRTFGPYSQFSSIDGIAYADSRIFAFYDTEQNDWYVFDDEKHWKSVRVIPDAFLPVRDADDPSHESPARTS